MLLTGAARRSVGLLLLHSCFRRLGWRQWEHRFCCLGWSSSMSGSLRWLGRDLGLHGGCHHLRDPHRRLLCRHCSRQGRPLGTCRLQSAGCGLSEHQAGDSSDQLGRWRVQERRLQGREAERRMDGAVLPLLPWRLTCSRMWCDCHG